MSAATQPAAPSPCARAHAAFSSTRAAESPGQPAKAPQRGGSGWTLAPPVLGANGAADVCSGVWESMRDRETNYMPRLHYLGAHPDLNPGMRAIMVDWMMEVCQEFLLKRETLHLAVSYVDRFLSRTRDCHKLRVQLVGVSALCIASKVEEIYPPKVSEFVATCDGAYSAVDLVTMERAMLDRLDWHLVPSTPYTWAVWYIHQLAAADESARAAPSPGQALSSVPASTDDRFAKMAPYASEGGGAFQPAARAALQLAPGPSGPCRGPAALGLVRDAGVAGIALDATPRLPSLRFDRALFERVMAVVDLMLLDVASLAFPPSLLVAAALYVVTADDRTTEAVTRYRLSELRPCVRYLRAVLAVVPARVTRHAREAYIRSKLHEEDWHTMQVHAAGPLEKMKAFISARERAGAQEAQERAAATAVTSQASAPAAHAAVDQPRRSGSEQPRAAAPVEDGSSDAVHSAAGATRKRARKAAEAKDEEKEDSGAAALYCSEAENVALAATLSAGRGGDSGDEADSAPSRRRARRR